MFDRGPFLYNCHLAKVKHFPEDHQIGRGSDTTWTSLNSIDCEKWCETLHQNIMTLKHFKDNSNLYVSESLSYYVFSDQEIS